MSEIGNRYRGMSWGAFYVPSHTWFFLSFGACPTETPRVLASLALDLYRERRIVSDGFRRLSMYITILEVGSPKIGGYAKNAYSPDFSRGDGREVKHSTGVFTLYVTRCHWYNNLTKFGGIGCDPWGGASPQSRKKNFFRERQPEKKLCYDKLRFLGSL